VIHSRDAVEDTYEILKRYAGGIKKFLLHSFSQSTEMMKRYLENNQYCFSVSGVVTFKNAHNVRETVSQIPMERLMIETDCPYMTPVPYRGKRNTPDLCTVRGGKSRGNEGTLLRRSLQGYIFECDSFF
jgi:TatD DNase family protein